MKKKKINKNRKKWKKFLQSSTGIIEEKFPLSKLKDLKVPIWRVKVIKNPSGSKMEEMSVKTPEEKIWSLQFEDPSQIEVWK